MKELAIYVCEICGREHTDRQTALDCEKAHVVPDKIITYYHTCFGSYPHEIRVQMKDGRVIAYTNNEY